MNHITKATCILLAGLTLGSTASAQDSRNQRVTLTTKTRRDASRAAITPQQQTALYMLDRIFDDAKTFDDDLLKIRTQAHVADLLWPYDEPRARRQLEESFRAIVSAKPTARGGDMMTMLLADTSPTIGLRNEVLSLIARRDADLAQKLIDSVTKAASDEGSGQSTPATNQRPRYDLYLQAALGIARSNPERAVQLAKAGLGGGINPEVLKLLLTLRQTSPALADDLFSAALLVARSDSANASVNIATLAPYALPEFIGSAGYTVAADSAALPSTPLIREFLSFAYDTFLQLSGMAAQLGLPGAGGRVVAPNAADFMTGQRLLPSFVRYMPGKAATFRQILDTIARSTKQINEVTTVSKLFQSGGVSELLEQAEAERNVHLKDLLYIRAGMSALAGEDFEQALSIVGKMGDQERRASFDSVIRLQAATASLKKDDVDAALRYAGGISDIRQRAFLYGKIARSLLDKEAVSRATEILDDAELAVGKADDGLSKANALIVLAEVRSRLNPVQGFVLLEAAVKTLNRADAGEAEQSQPATASGNPITAMMLNSVFKLDALNFEPVFSHLAKFDFHRAAQLAQALERRDRSAAAQIAICRSVLSGERTKTARTIQGAAKRD